MADLEKTIQELKEIKGKVIPKLAAYYGSGPSSIFACEKYGEALDNAISLLKEREPQPPKHIHQEYIDHDWERCADGSIDEFAAENGYHNGPRCKRCGESFCVHCEPEGYETHKPCIVDEDHCPKCGNVLFRPWGKDEKITHCMKCGQAVKWE